MSFLIQVEAFEEEDLDDVENELNKFLAKLDDENIVSIRYEVKSVTDGIQKARLIYEALVIYRLKGD